MTIDWSKLPHYPAPPGKCETKWLNPETFFDELPAVMKSVPPAPNDLIYLVMRLYNPKPEAPSILPPGEGTWQPPDLVKTN